MKYQRVAMTGYGGPEVLQLVEEELSRPRAGEVRVKVLAAGVAFADVLMRRGMYLGAPKPPFTPGYEMVGVVEEVGPQVQGLMVGQQVAALTIRGSYAQQILLPAGELVPVADGLDPALAAVLPLNYVSAHQMLHRVARVQPGQRILVHGAAGGVGTAMLQLGRLAGLEMYGTASPAKHDLVRSLGATPIDYRSEDFVERIAGGVDAAFDPIGGSHLWRSFRALRRGGRVVGYGFAAGLKDGKRIPWMAPYSIASTLVMGLAPGRSASFYSVGIKRQHPDWYRDDLLTLLGYLAERKIAPVIAERFPLSQAARAQDLLERSAVSGKIILLPHPSPH